MPRCVFHTEFAVRVDVVIKAGSPMHHYITYGTRTANSWWNSLRIRVLSLYAGIRRLFTWIDLQCASNFGFSGNQNIDFSSGFWSIVGSYLELLI